MAKPDEFAAAFTVIGWSGLLVPHSMRSSVRCVGPTCWTPALQTSARSGDLLPALSRAGLDEPKFTQVTCQ